MLTPGRMQRTSRAILVAIGIFAAGALAAPARAASSSPAATPQPWAATVDMGFTNQSGDGNFDARALLGASLERYSSPNVSWRGAMSMHSFGDPAVQQPFRTIDDEDIMAFNGNVLYHWQGNQVQPFVTGGVGLYEYQHSFSPDRSEVGVDLGGGLDVLASSTIAVKFEALYHQTTASSHDTFVEGSAGVRFRW